jgi:hypothetical protein
MRARRASATQTPVGSIHQAANSDYFATTALAMAFGEPWEEPMPLSPGYPADISEVLSSVEDLWLRIARHPNIHSAVLNGGATGEPLVLFRIQGKGGDRPQGMDRHEGEGGGYDLLEAASLRSSYSWDENGSKGNLTSDIHWVGNTLVIELTPLHQMRCAPGGDALIWAMQGILHPLKGQGGGIESANPVECA